MHVKYRRIISPHLQITTVLEISLSQAYTAVGLGHVIRTPAVRDADAWRRECVAHNTRSRLTDSDVPCHSRRCVV